MDALYKMLIDRVLELAAANPKLAVVFLVLQTSRVIFKPLCSLIQAYVDSTDTVFDNDLWMKAQDSKVFKVIAYILDYALSIKLPKTEAPVVAPAPAK
jgi:hypothetical protein